MTYWLGVSIQQGGRRKPVRKRVSRREAGACAPRSQALRSVCRELLAQPTEGNDVRACGQLLAHLRAENELEVPRSRMAGRNLPQPAYQLLQPCRLREKLGRHLAGLTVQSGNQKQHVPVVQPGQHRNQTVFDDRIDAGGRRLFEIRGLFSRRRFSVLDVAAAPDAELPMWEHLWHDSFRELPRLLHGRVKAVRPGVQFGSHIWLNHSRNPVFRAEQELSEMAAYHDFIKVPLYYNCGGPRMASYIESVSETVWGDVPPDELLQYHYRVLNYDEAPFKDVRRAGLYRGFVYRESKRAMDGARGAAVSIPPGIEIDIPVMRANLAGAPAEVARCTRESVRDVVKQAFRAEVPGVILSREYTEMRPENLSGVGDAIRELGLKT